MLEPVALTQIFVWGLALGGAYALIASGMTLVWAVTKQVNVSHGDFLVLSMFGCYSAYTGLHFNPYVSVFITAPAMFILGLLVFHFLFKPIMDRSGPLITFFAFLGFAFGMESLLSVFYGADYVSTPVSVQSLMLNAGSVRIPVTHLAAFLVSVIVSLGFHYLLKKTYFGRAVQAVAQNPTEASLMGINVRRIQTLVFAMAFVLLALAASLLMPIWTINAFQGLSFTLFAFIIVVLGGMGNFMGALFAALILGLAEAYSAYFLGAALAPALPYAIFVLILLFRPSGLFASREA